MQIKIIQSFSQNILYINIDNINYIYELKTMIYNNINIIPKAQKLSINNIILNDEDCLDKNILNNNTVLLCIIPVACKDH